MRIGTALLLFAIAAVSPEMQYFRYERPIQNLPQQSGQACFVVKPEIFANSAMQLADLRIYSNGVETPFAIHRTIPSASGEKILALLNIGVRGEQTVFDVAIPEGPYNDLQLSVTAQNFIASVAVSGSQSQDARAETKLGSFTIFDLTRQRLGRSTVLHLPKSDFRYLHFRVTGPLTPQNISGLSIARQDAAGPPTYTTVIESARTTIKGHTEIFEFTVPAHVPVDRILFLPGTDPASFSRNVNISVTSDLPATSDSAERQYKTSASGNLLRVHIAQSGHRIDEERLSIDAPSADFDFQTKWTITVENGDDAPLKLETVRLQMVERNLCFQSVGGSQYTLFYGDDALTGPVYDYATLFAMQPDAAKATTGPEQLNSAYRSRPDTRPFTERHPALLWGALLAVIAVLGGIALRTAKRTAPPTGS